MLRTTDGTRELRYVNPTSSAINQEAKAGTPIIIINDVEGKIPPSPKGYNKSVNIKTGQVTYIRTGYKPIGGWGATPVGVQMAAGTFVADGSPEAVKQAKAKEAEIEKDIKTVGIESGQARFSSQQLASLERTAQKYGLSSEALLADPIRMASIIKTDTSGDFARDFGVSQASALAEDISFASETGKGLGKYSLEVYQEGRRLKARGEELQKGIGEGKYPTASIKAYNKAVAEFERKSGKIGSLQTEFKFASKRMEDRQAKVLKDIKFVEESLVQPTPVKKETDKLSSVKVFGQDVTLPAELDVTPLKGVQPFFATAKNISDKFVSKFPLGLAGTFASSAGILYEFSTTDLDKAKRIAEAPIEEIPFYGKTTIAEEAKSFSELPLDVKKLKEDAANELEAWKGLERREKFKQELKETGLFKESKTSKKEDDFYITEFKAKRKKRAESESKMFKSYYELQKFGRYEDTPKSTRLAFERGLQVAGVYGTISLLTGGLGMAIVGGLTGFEGSFGGKYAGMFAKDVDVYTGVDVSMLPKLNVGKTLVQYFKSSPLPPMQVLGIAGEHYKIITGDPLKRAEATDVAFQVAVPIAVFGSGESIQKWMRKTADTALVPMRIKQTVTDVKQFKLGKIGGNLQKIRAEGLGMKSYVKKFGGQTVFERKAIISVKGSGFSGLPPKPLTATQNKLLTELKKGLPVEKQIQISKRIFKEGTYSDISGRVKTEFFKKDFWNRAWGEYSATKIPFSEKTLSFKTFETRGVPEKLSTYTTQTPFEDIGIFATKSDFGGIKSVSPRQEYVSTGLIRSTTREMLGGGTIKRVKILGDTMLSGDKFTAYIDSVTKSKVVTPKLSDMAKGDSLGGFKVIDFKKAGPTGSETLTDSILRSELLKEMKASPIKGSVPFTTKPSGQIIAPSGRGEAVIQKILTPEATTITTPTFTTMAKSMATVSPPGTITATPLILTTGPRTTTEIKRTLTLPKITPITLTARQIKKLSSTKEKQVLLTLTGTRTPVKTKEKTGTVTIPTMKELIKSMEKEESKVLTLTQTGLKAVNVEKDMIMPTMPKLLTRTIQRQKQKQAILPTTLTATGSPFPKEQIPSPVIYTLFELPKLNLTKQKVNKRMEKGFDVYLKREGQFRKITTKPLSKQKALGFGALKTDITAGATFKLKPTEKKVRKQGSREWERLKKQFRIGKGGTFVEKNIYRISTKGEKEEITLKGLQKLAQFPNLFGKKKKKKKKGRFF